MSRLLTAMLVLLIGSSAVPAAEPARRNVLFLISDDLNNLLGCYGDTLARTPNIDRLAARGVRFDRAYCTFPQTIPAQRSLPQVFRNSGYFAARIGKLYHYNVPNSIGTNGHDDPGSWEAELNPAGVDRLEEQPNIFSLLPGQFGGTLSWYASPKEDRFHTDALEADDAEWVLERCATHKDRPFFLAVGFFRPHTPYVSPKAYFDLHPEKDMPVVQGVAEDQADLPKPALGSHKKEQEKLTDDLRRQCRQAYNASISFMDAQVGRVVATLDRLGLAENTVIVFTSDHGYHMGEHGLWQKMSLFEESARVPLLVVAPGTSTKGSVAASPVSHVDLFPTLCELCGVKAPANVQGQSLVPILKDPQQPGRGWALTQVVRGGGSAGRATVVPDAGSEGNRFFGYSLRTPRWRYTEWDEGEKGRELYDHDADPRELTNLASDPAHAKTIEDLSQQLRTAARSTFPADGKTPVLKPGFWAPNLTDP